jgi:hypothetical protein
MTDKTIVSECFRVLNVVIEQWSFLPFESSIYTWKKMMTVAESFVPAGIYSYN